MTLVHRLKQYLAAKSLFSKVFRGIFLVSLLSVVFIWYWLNSRFYNSLNKEAELRLGRLAKILVEDIAIETDAKEYETQASSLRAIWNLEKQSGLVQNFYWLDLSNEEPRFIASYSAIPDQEDKLRIAPPSPVEIEDLVFDYINQLDRGEIVFPDPFAHAAARKIKIVLCPVFDRLGFLHSVIGIEADMEYLKLAMKFRRMLFETIILVILLSLCVSIFLAHGISSRVENLQACVKQLENGCEPIKHLDGISELDRLYASFLSMARALDAEKSQIATLYKRKLDELAFTGGAIAHEIRNPLSAIEMHFGLLRREIEKCRLDKNMESIKEISEQLLHLRKLLENFLNYSRKVVPTKEFFRLKAFVEEIVSSRQSVLGSFSAKCSIDDDMEINFDRTMLRQILENLVNNSYAAADGENLEVKVEASVNSRKLSLRIINNGPAIPDEMMEKLFTPFVSQAKGGSGFGLAMVQKLVEAHSGKVSAINVGERGVEFLIEVWQ